MVSDSDGRASDLARRLSEERAHGLRLRGRLAKELPRLWEVESMGDSLIDVGEFAVKVRTLNGEIRIKEIKVVKS